mgnify:FL=1
MSRRQAREAALQALFQLDLNGEENIAEQEKYETLAVDMALGEAEPLGKKDRAYVTEVVHGTRENLVSIDADIAGAAKNWKVARMATIDRNLVRLALYEIFYAEATLSSGIAINEAVELAKKFGSDDSGRYVNGVLGAVVKKHEE